MARIRSLKPEAFQSETLAEVSVNAERTFFGLTTIVDDRGRIADKPAQINGELWSMRGGHAAADLDGELEALGKTGDQLVCRYTGCDGKRYLHLVTWDRHQKIDHPSKIRLPRCPHHLLSITGRAEECGLHEGNCPPARETLANPREGSRPVRPGNGSIASPSGEPESTPETSEDGSEKPAPSDQQEPESSRNSRESSRDVETYLGPRTVDLGSGKPSRRGGKRADTGSQQSLPGAPEKAETTGQRVNRLVKTYTDRVPLTAFQGARECVKRAVDAGVDDETLTRGLTQLADENRDLTLANLRKAIYGTSSGSGGGKPSTTSQRVQSALERAARYEQEEAS